MKWSKLVKCFSVAFLLIVFAVMPQPISADLVGNPWPGQKVSPVSCEPTSGHYEYGSVHAYPPSFVRSSGDETERVIWTPVLYRAEGNEWVLASDEMPSAYAFATPDGIVDGWFHLKTHEPLTVSSVKSEFGDYKVVNTIYGEVDTCIAMSGFQTVVQYCREPENNHPFPKNSAAGFP